MNEPTEEVKPKFLTAVILLSIIVIALLIAVTYLLMERAGEIQGKTIVPSEIKENVKACIENCGNLDFAYMVSAIKGREVILCEKINSTVMKEDCKRMIGSL